LTAIVMGGGFTPYSYLWSNTQTGQTATSLCAGTYTCTVMDSVGCDTAIASGTINQSTAIALSLSATPDSGSVNGTATVTATGGTQPYSYLWENSQTDSTATGLSSGFHSVTVTDANGCPEVDSVNVPLFIGVSQYSTLNAQYSIYPNPVRTEMNLNLTLASSEIVRIVLLNTLGQETILFNQHIEKGDKTLKLETEKLSTGIYYMQIVIGENTPEYLKFVKAR
ncbi:MAG: T9SS type A sorting domain-containing protein, partial [Bacteroidota bacterium]